MNETMPQVVEASGTEYSYSASMQHQPLPRYDHPGAASQIETQAAAYAEYEMHTLHSYMSVPVDYTVAPRTAGLSQTPMASTPGQCVWPSTVDGAGETMDGIQADGASFEANVMGAPGGDSYQLYGYYPTHQIYPFQALGTTSPFPESTLFHYSNQNPVDNARQPWNPTPEVEIYQQPPTDSRVPVQTAASSPSLPNGTHDKSHNDNDAKPQPPVPRKRGRPRKLKKVDLPPVVTTSIIAASQELQPPPPSSTSLGTWTSHSSPTSYLSSANGSTSTSRSELMSCDVKVEQEQSHSCWDHVETRHPSPLVTETPPVIQSGSSIPSSPPTRTVPSISVSYQQQQQQQQQQEQEQQLPSYSVTAHQVPFCSASSSIPGEASSYQQPQQRMIPTSPTTDPHHRPFSTRQSSMASLHTGHGLHALGRHAVRKDQKSRNRVAATKCRLKTKAATTALEEEEKVESERNFVLSGMVARLREEYFMLRNQLLMHSNCNCTLIRQYLEKQARLLAETGNCYPSVNQDRKGSSADNSMLIEEDGDDACGSEDAEGEEWDAQTMVDTKKVDEPAFQKVEEAASQMKKKRRAGRPGKGSNSTSSSSPVAAATPPGSPAAATTVGSLVQVREKVVRRRLTRGNSLVTGMTPRSGQRLAGLVQ